MCFSHLGVFLISVKPLTTENTENKTTPKICKITVYRVIMSKYASEYDVSKDRLGSGGAASPSS